MKKLNVGHTQVSRLCLGGAQMKDLSTTEGMLLVDEAVRLGINVFDGHHRYGNCENILGQFPNIVKMTKISAYNFHERYALVQRSKDLLGDIDIFWISDLDDKTLYKYGADMYEEFRSVFPHVGITTENTDLGYKFLTEYPECNLFMVPLHHGRLDMGAFTYDTRKEGKIVFGIKTLCGGECLRKYSVEQAIDFVKSFPPDVIVIGTSKIEHLRELVKLYGEE